MQPPTLTYKQFIQQPNWENTLSINYLTEQHPLTILDQSFNTLDNDTDHFAATQHPITYLSKLPEPARDHLTKALILKIKDPYYAYVYARDIIEGRWPEAEGIINQDLWYIHYYANDVIKGRWPEAEETICQNPFYSYYYALLVIKGRWPEAEKTISQNPQCAHLYAKYVIKGRWPEAKAIIQQSPWPTYDYANHQEKY